MEWAQREYKWSKQRESEVEDDKHDHVVSITQPLEWAWGDEGPSVPWRPVTRFEVRVDRVEWVCGKTGKTFKWFFPSGDSLACIEADEKALGARGCGRPLHGTLETSCGDAARTDSKGLSTYTKRGGSRTWWTWKDEDTSAWFELKEKHSKVALFKAPSEEEAHSIVGQVQLLHKKWIELEKLCQSSAAITQDAQQADLFATTLPRAPTFARGGGGGGGGGLPPAAPAGGSPPAAPSGGGGGGGGGGSDMSSLEARLAALQ